MMKNTFHRPDLAARESLKAVTRLSLAWLRGPKYGFAFTRFQLQAVWDGYLNRLGRTITPVEKNTSSH
jgi:hypothetical protein